MNGLCKISIVQGGIFIMLVPGVVASLLCAVVEFIMDKKSRRSWRRDGPVRKTNLAFHQ